jgi:hypothetical protein
MVVGDAEFWIIKDDQTGPRRKENQSNENARVGPPLFVGLLSSENPCTNLPPSG